jgi:Cysteine rich repeat
MSVGEFYMMRRVALIATALAMVSSVALAQESTRPRGACREDIQKLCAGIERGGGRIRECLAGQKDKLSDECRTQVESRSK